MRYVFLFVFVWLTEFGFCQSDSLDIQSEQMKSTDALQLAVDKLYSNLSESTSVSDSIVILEKIFETYRDQRNLNKAEETVDRIISLLRRDQGEVGFNKYRIKLVPIYAMTGRIDAARQLCNELISFFENTRDSKELGTLYQYGANLSSTTEAIIFLNKARAIFSDQSDEANLASCDIMLGGVYLGSKMYDEGYASLKSGISILEKRNQHNALAPAYSNLAGTFYEMNKKSLNSIKIDTAISYYEKSLDAYRLINDEYGVGQCYTNIGMLKFESGKYEESIQILLKGIELRNISEERYPLYRPFYSLAYSYFMIGRVESTEKYLKLATQELKKLGKELPSTDRIYLDISNLYMKLKNSNKAYKYLLEHTYLSDSLYKISKLDALSDAAKKYQTEKKEAENKLLLKEKELNQATIKSQRTSLWASIGGAGLLGLVSFLFYRQSQERKKKNAILAEQKEQIEALHKDLGHRVKNNLFFVSTLMKIQEGEARIEAMSLLHRKLNLNDSDAKIPIREYIEELCANLQHTFPYTDRKPSIKIDAANVSIDGDRAMRLGLIVNELVTNSFKHAFHNEPEPRIDIRLDEQNPDRYRLTFQDNGIGIPAEIDIDKARSMGLKLIHTLTRQLNGSVRMSDNDGARFEIDFTDKTKAA